MPGGWCLLRQQAVHGSFSSHPIARSLLLGLRIPAAYPWGLRLRARARRYEPWQYRVLSSTRRFESRRGQDTDGASPHFSPPLAWGGGAEAAGFHIRPASSAPLFVSPEGRSTASIGAIPGTGPRRDPFAYALCTPRSA